MGRTFATPSGKVGPVCCGMGNSRKINYNLVEENDKFMIREERKCCDKGERPHSGGGGEMLGVRLSLAERGRRLFAAEKEANSKL